jgi:hypothetical protein
MEPIIHKSYHTQDQPMEPIIHNIPYTNSLIAHWLISSNLWFASSRRFFSIKLSGHFYKEYFQLPLHEEQDHFFTL